VISKLIVVVKHQAHYYRLFAIYYHKLNGLFYYINSGEISGDLSREKLTF